MELTGHKEVLPKDSRPYDRCYDSEYDSWGWIDSVNLRNEAGILILASYPGNPGFYCGYYENGSKTPVGEITLHVFRLDGKEA